MERVLKYQAIESYMLQELSSQRFALNDRFFSEHDIARQFNVTVLTARKAFARLEEKGYIVRQRGCGTFVKALPEQPQRLKIIKRCIIGIIVGDCARNNDLKLGRMLIELHRAIEKAGYLALLIGEDFKILHETEVSGVIVLDRIADHRLRQLLHSGIPAIGMYPACTVLPSPSFDVADAADRIMERFHQSGTRRIAMVGEGEDALIVRNLFEKEMATAAAKRNIELVTVVSPIGSTHAEFAALMDEDRYPDAIWAMNSWSLDSISNVLREKGLQMGKDVSVLVHGSNALEIPGTPGYSVIDLDVDKAAMNSVQLLQQLIRDPHVKLPHVISPYGPIIERGSIRPKQDAESTGKQLPESQNLPQKQLSENV